MEFRLRGGGDHAIHPLIPQQQLAIGVTHAVTREPGVLAQKILYGRSQQQQGRAMFMNGGRHHRVGQRREQAQQALVVPAGCVVGRAVVHPHAHQGQHAQRQHQQQQQAVAQVRGHTGQTKARCGAWPVGIHAAMTPQGLQRL